MSEITITSENYENEVIKSDKPVLLDFWAPWCGPCKMMSPVISDLAKELEGKVKVCKINVDEQEALASQFSVMSIPFLAVMKNGKLSKASAGYMPKDMVLKLLED